MREVSHFCFSKQCGTAPVPSASPRTLLKFWETVRFISLVYLYFDLEFWFLPRLMIFSVKKFMWMNLRSMVFWWFSRSFVCWIVFRLVFVAIRSIDCLKSPRLHWSFVFCWIRLDCEIILYWEIELHVSLQIFEKKLCYWFLNFIFYKNIIECFWSVCYFERIDP